MTYQIRQQTLTPESFDEWDRAVHARAGEKTKPRSRGTSDLMSVFGLAKR